MGSIYTEFQNPDPLSGYTHGEGDFQKFGMEKILAGFSIIFLKNP